jgi:hypothetical protein
MKRRLLQPPSSSSLGSTCDDSLQRVNVAEKMLPLDVLSPQKRLRISKINGKIDSQQASGKKSLILPSLPIELFDHILSFLDQSFIVQNFSLVCILFNELIKSELIWKKRVFTITKTDKHLRLDLAASVSHVQISNPKFRLFSAFYFSKLSILELFNSFMTVSQLAFLILTNASLTNISLSNLKVSIDDDFKSISRKFGGLENCVSIRWHHVCFNSVSILNEILKELLGKCTNLETLQFATQNDANLDTVKIIFRQSKLKNLSLSGVDELYMDDFLKLYSNRQWNFINIQSCKGLCRSQLLPEICKLPCSSNLKELTLKFEHSSSSNNEYLCDNYIAMNHLQILRLHNINRIMMPLVTDIINQCAKTLQVLSIHVASGELDNYKDNSKKILHFSQSKFPNLKQISTSNLPFKICAEFQLPVASPEKITVFGTGEKMDPYLKMSKPFEWDRLRVLFLENVSFSRTKNLINLIFSIPNLEVLKFSYVICEFNAAASEKLVVNMPKTNLTDLEVQDSALSAEFYSIIFSASPKLKHLKLSNMESDHVVDYSYHGFIRFFEQLTYTCRNLLTLNLEIRACPYLKDLRKAYCLTRVQQVSILDIMKLRFDEALTFILSVTNAFKVQLFIDSTQMMEGSFYFFKDIRSFYEHMLLQSNKTVDYFQTNGNFASFVFQLIRDRLEFALPCLRLHQKLPETIDQLRHIFDNLDTLKSVQSCWQFYLFCGLSLALINPTLKMCCERDLGIHVDQFNWSIERVH